MKKVLVAGLVALMFGCGQGDYSSQESFRRPELPNLSNEKLFKQGYGLNGDGLGGYWWEGLSGFEALGGGYVDYVDNRRK